jgi:2-dehydro-3-deoxygalactonokinase
MNHRLFFSCDWGTSSFRLRLAEFEGGRIVDECREAEGAKVIYNRLAEQGRATDPVARGRAFEEFLLNRLALLAHRQQITAAGIPVVISGMASSTVGWKEVPYGAAPFSLDGAGVRTEMLRVVDVTGSVTPVTLVSGLTTGHDMMRGEETEILGLLSHPEWQSLANDCVMVLPGTHSKHVRVRSGSVTDFRTHMTGELIELLSTQSLLKVSVRWPLAESPDGGIPDGLRGEFQRGVELAHAEGLGRGLFQTRVRSVLEQAPPDGNGWFLNGLVVGAEMADLIRWSPTSPILLATTRRFAASYRLALETLGVGDRVRAATADQMEQASVRAHVLILRQREREQRTP